MINCKTYDRGYLRQAHLWNTAYIQMSECKGFPSNQATYISMKHNSNLSTYRLHMEAVYIRTITPR